MRRVSVLVATLAIVTSVFVGTPRTAFAAVGANNIYVGSEQNSNDGISSCNDPDFGTDGADEGSINAALEAALAAVDHAGDSILICDGLYTFANNLSAFDATESGSGFPVITIAAAPGADVVLDGNGYQFLHAVGADLTIRGITFRYFGSMGGALQADGADVAHTLIIEESSFYGNLAVWGGALNLVNMNLTIRTSTFGAVGEPNEAARGGAIYLDSALGVEDLAVVIEDSTFTNNDAADYGGALYIQGETSIAITNSTFTENSALNECGGAMLLNAANGGVISKSTFAHNMAGSTGGAITSQTCSDGADYPASLLTVRNSLFEANDAGCAGGAIESLSLIVSESTFKSNAAGDCAGGAIASWGAQFELTGNTFEGNTLGNACCHGGAVYFATDNTATPVITSNTFTQNHASSYGGALALWQFGNAPMNVRNISRNRFTRNVASRGGAIIVSGCAATSILRRASAALLRANRFSRNAADSSRSRDIDASKGCVG